MKKFKEWKEKHTFGITIAYMAVSIGMFVYLFITTYFI